uniref:sensor histidine kinase n=1 Tax=Actinomadura formosensis TaxID=60706 RepID=UPI000A06555B
MRADGDLGRWPRLADFGVPLLLLGVQLSITWLLADYSAQRWTVITILDVLSAGALVWRRVVPGPVLALTVLLNAAAVPAAGADAISGVSDSVALYSLAVHRERRPAVIGCLAAFSVAFAVAAPYAEGAGDLLAGGVLDAFSYLVITALGQLRRHQKAMRRDLRARIEQDNRAAAEAERERLARDVHDIVGHHLSAVAVHSGAAVRRADPELTRQALTIAAGTGREVLKSLSRLVDVVGPQAEGGELKALLPPLCHGLTRLGVPVSLTVKGRVRRLPAEVTATVYRIVQESLTNAMRYASGAPVQVAVRHRCAGQCSGLQAGGEGPRGRAAGPGRALTEPAQWGSWSW